MVHDNQPSLVDTLHTDGVVSFRYAAGIMFLLATLFFVFVEPNLQQHIENQKLSPRILYSIPTFLLLSVLFFAADLWQRYKKQGSLTIRALAVFIAACILLVFSTRNFNQRVQAHQQNSYQTIAFLEHLYSSRDSRIRYVAIESAFARSQENSIYLKLLTQALLDGDERIKKRAQELLQRSQNSLNQSKGR